MASPSAPAAHCEITVRRGSADAPPTATRAAAIAPTADEISDLVMFPPWPSIGTSRIAACVRAVDGLQTGLCLDVDYFVNNLVANILNYAAVASRSIEVAHYGVALSIDGMPHAKKPVRCREFPDFALRSALLGKASGEARFGIRDHARTREKIEIASFVGLKNMLRE
jgi:hypothetical protein